MAFFGVHFLVGASQEMARWVQTGVFATDLSSFLSRTPLRPMLSEQGTFSGGINDINPLSALGLAVDSMRVMLGMVSFNYSIFDADGIVGMFGDLLTLAGALVAAYMLFIFARAVAGSLGFAR